MAEARVAVPFPTERPIGYDWFEDEPTFDPERHLALEEPSEIVMLTDLGYTAQEIEGVATPVGCSSPFRVLSDEGADVMLTVARRLREFTKPAGVRIERMTRGGCYRSRWLRDLCLSPDVTAHLAAIYGTDIAPHAMPCHLGHLNYEPSQPAAPIDKWHHDTLPLDYVLTVTDPATVQGGRFEYFAGTKDEAAELSARGETPPEDRVVVPEFGGAGYAIALHGNMIVHRAAPLEVLSERISMVNGYVAANPTAQDQNRTKDLIGVDDPELLWAEWARYSAWRTQSKLTEVINSIEFTSDRDTVVAQLKRSIVDVERAIAEMQEDETVTEHYE